MVFRESSGWLLGIPLESRLQGLLGSSRLSVRVSLEGLHGAVKEFLEGVVFESLGFVMGVLLGVVSGSLSGRLWVSMWSLQGHLGVSS